MTFAFQAIFMGVVATAFMDLMAYGQSRLLGSPSLNYAMVGRWIGHLGKGKLVHPSIAEAAPIPAEAALGWSAHYLIGILFAAVFLLLAGPAANTLSPIWPIGFGVLTVAAPFLVLQPGMGAGIAACKTPAPWKARARSLKAHVIFGVGLWLAAWLWASIIGI